MRNKYMRPAEDLALPVPAGTRSGDPVRVGAANGVAATHVGEGGNASGHASVDLSASSYEYEVDGAIATPFTPVYLTARDGDTAPVLTTTDPADGTNPWGYTVPKVGESGVRAATSGVAVVRPAQV